MGVIVDQSKPGSVGNSNNGNTARRFFSELVKSVLITGIDEQLIRHFSVILLTISSGFSVDVEKFDAFAFKTRDLYLQLYPWYLMPVSVHKVLIHGGE